MSSDLTPNQTSNHAMTRNELKAMQENLQLALDDAIARGVLTTPLNSAISRIIATLRARLQATVV